MPIIILIGVVFLFCLLKVYKEETETKRERYDKDPKTGNWKAQCQNPERQMIGALCTSKPNRRQRVEYGLTHMGYYPPYCNRKHKHCRECGLCHGDGTKDCRGYTVVNGTGAFAPSECLNCKWRRKHENDPFWDCGHPQAQNLMRDANMGLGICRPMFGPNVSCPYQRSDVGVFTKDWEDAKRKFYEWNDLLREFIDNCGIQEIRDGTVVWKKDPPYEPPGPYEGRSGHGNGMLALAMYSHEQYNKKKSFWDRYQDYMYRHFWK